MRRLIILAAALVALVLLIAEAAMQPSREDRFLLSSTFSLAFLITLGVGWALLTATRRLRSLRTTFLLIPIGAVGVATVTVGAAALTMFLSVHDLRLTLVALVLGIGLGTSLALAVSRPLAEDLERLSLTARTVAGGDTTARTEVYRPDEVGQVARALDGMIAELHALEAERQRDEESRRAFLAAVSHDLRTPLTSLQAAVEALQDGMAPDPERYLRSMSHDLGTLRGLVDDLFMLARIEVGDLELQPIRIDAVELVEETLEAMRPLGASRDVDLLLDTRRSVTLEADPRAMARVVRNLVDNAIRHTPHDTEVRVAVTEDGGGVSVQVRDQGPGFPDGFRGSAWKDSTRADPSRPRDGAGGGLGLTIARGLVEAHGGTIWITDGVGGEVAFWLPRDWIPADVPPDGFV